MPRYFPQFSYHIGSSRRPPPSGAGLATLFAYIDGAASARLNLFLIFEIMRC
jgi:hypothetical protein